METTNVKEQIEKAINDAGGITAAARALGMPRKTLEEWRDRSEWPDNYKTAMVKSFLDHALLHPGDRQLMIGN